MNVSLSGDLIQSVLWWQTCGWGFEQSVARFQIVSIVKESESLLVFKTIDGKRRLQRDRGLHTSIEIFDSQAT